MRATISLIIMGILSTGVLVGQVDRKKGGSLEHSGVQVIPIEDTGMRRQYELYIELPEGYSEHLEKRYPVLYYTDALWHIDILSAGAEYILTEAILVGISWQKDIDKDLLKEHGAHVSRYRDYSLIPSSSPELQAKYEFGQAANHLDFIRNDVIPYVEGHYRTDPDQRSYFGYSAGGVFGAYVLLSQPDTFKNYILGSPALKGDIPFLSGLKSEEALNASIFISYGSLEEELGGYVDQLINLLNARNDKSLSLTHKVIEGNHQTAFPLTSVKAVTWLVQLLDK